MTGPRVGIDPDIEQAIDDLLPLVPELLLAKAKLDRLGSSGDIDKVGAVRTSWLGLRADIATRAERIGTTLDGMLVILDVEAGLRKQFGRLAARHVVERCIADKLGKREPRLRAAAAAHDDACAAVARAEARAARTKRAGAKDLAEARPKLLAAKAEADEAERRVNAAREALRAYRGVEQSRAA